MIPDFTTAAAQYAYAVRYQNAQVLVGDSKKRARQWDEIIQCYQKVIDNFPDDQKHTPQAHVVICTCVAESGRYQQAVAMYREVMRKYPDNQSLQARCLYHSARALDRDSRFREAKGLYREVIDRFRDSQDPTIREVVKRAAVEYQRVHKQPRR